MTTSVDVKDLRKPMEATHASGVNYTYAWRVQQLKAVKNMILSHENEWTEAVKIDLHKDVTETKMVELFAVTSEVDYLLSILKNYMKPQSVAGPYYQIVGFSHVEHKPLSSPGVLVIAPFNYPISLALLPLVGSLAGGNPTILKPSELTPSVSALMARLIPQYLDAGAVQVVEGGVKEVTELLEYSWGKVVFTGSERVGRIVAQATAKALTPTLLELGGKSPVFVDETAPRDLTSVANRIIWGKTFNAGQTCIAPDYVLVHEQHASALCRELVQTIERQFGKDPKHSELGRIVTREHAQRHVDMMTELERSACGGRLCGGSAECSVNEKYIAPSIFVNPPPDCRLMREEIFGPILPVITVKSRQDAIEFIQQQYGTPLALYVFTRYERVYQEVTRKCPAGGACRNDVMLQGGSSCLPFGGLGTSGYGNYHGKHSLDAFTHKFASVYRPCFPGSDFGMIRYHPFQGIKRVLLVDVLGKLPYTPVLHTRKVVIVLSALLCLTYIPAFDPWRGACWQTLGSVFQSLADWTVTCAAQQ